MPDSLSKEGTWLLAGDQQVVEVAPGFEVLRARVTSARDRWTDHILIRVRLNGETHDRIWTDSDLMRDSKDWRIANSFVRRAEQARDMGYPETWLTEWCMAVEYLFPELREKLPA